MGKRAAHSPIITGIQIFDSATNQFWPVSGDSGGVILGLDPTAGYKISDVDTTGDPSYTGYVNKDGAWYIVEANAANKTYRYSSGTSGYAAAWTGRAELSFGYFNEAF